MIALLIAAVLAGGAGCHAAARSLAIGESIDPAAIVATACRGDAARAAIGYDRATRQPVARAPIAAGDFLGRVIASRAVVAAGTELVLRATARHIVIERAVTALRPASAGQRLFVRTADGDVVVAALADAL